VTLTETAPAGTARTATKRTDISVLNGLVIVISRSAQDRLPALYAALGLTDIINIGFAPTVVLVGRPETAVHGGIPFLQRPLGHRVVKAARGDRPYSEDQPCRRVVMALATNKSCGLTQLARVVCNSMRRGASPYQRSAPMVVCYDLTADVPQPIEPAKAAAATVSRWRPMPGRWLARFAQANPLLAQRLRSRARAY
jgi:hypothetical protein